jgi:hypothetical protein
MKKGLLPNGSEVFTFGIENSLKIFPPNTFKFKPKNHIILDEVQSCILDNFWYQYNNRREDKGYMLSILNSLAEYFNMMNKKGSISSNIDIQEIKPLYVLFDGINPGIYMTFEEIIKEKMVARKKKEDLTWKKYIDFNEALKQARSIIGENYYIEPEAKEYIQKSKGKDKNIPASPTQKGEVSNSKRIKEEDSPKYETYKDCLLKGVDPLDIEYVNIKIEEKFEDSKKSLKEEILKEIRAEFDEKFEEIKKEYLTKYDFNLSDDDHMDIAGHGQKPE